MSNEPLKATLTVVLKANDVVVAEAEDAVLWQRILNAINSGRSEDLAGQATRSMADRADAATDDLSGSERSEVDVVARFARELGLDQDVVVGAVDPSVQPPYLQLDPHCWEAMRKSLPARGPGSVAPIALAATLLTLWFRSAGLGSPTAAQAQQVLGTIGVRDQNPSRSLANVVWLLNRGSHVALNPAQISRAKDLAQSFCSQQWAAKS